MTRILSALAWVPAIIYAGLILLSHRPEDDEPGEHEGWDL